MVITATVSGPNSVVRGMPLDQEPGLGALSIPGYLREVVDRYGDSEAVVLNMVDVQVRWSYRDLYRESLAVARALVAAGVGKDSRVGILMTNRPEYLSAMFGIAMAGGVAVALSTFSTPAELEHLLASSAISTLLFEDSVLKKDFLAVLKALEPAIADASPGGLASAKFPFLQRLVVLDGVVGRGRKVTASGAVETWEGFVAAGRAVDGAVVEARAAAVKPADAGGLFFSSGTTSLPKGILHSQRGFTVQWWRWPRVMGITESARAWTGNGFFWSGNISQIIGVAFSTGGAVILQPLFDAADVVRLVEAERVSYMGGRPHQWARMIAQPGYQAADLSSLKYITRGELLWEHPRVDTSWKMPMAFGTTETMSIMTSEGGDAGAARKPGSAGPPLPGNIMKIVDPETGAPVPVGERGEVCIKGPTTMLGYIGKTAEETFDDEGFYCTGDGGYIDADGHLFWEGRLNDIIKTGGANVAPQEVDEVLARYPGVKRTQTVGLPHETLSEIVVSCVVPVGGESLNADAIVAYLKEQLASFKVPREVLFFTEEEFSLTGNEKIKAADIKKLAAARLGIDPGG